jgi:predicted transcriptional regulator
MAKEFLSSNELTMKTGCIGGQLYHHLSILEAAKIICKNSELYTLTEAGKSKIDQILNMVYGE